MILGSLVYMSHFPYCNGANSTRVVAQKYYLKVTGLVGSHYEAKNLTAGAWFEYTVASSYMSIIGNSEVISIGNTVTGSNRIFKIVPNGNTIQFDINNIQICTTPYHCTNKEYLEPTGTQFAVVIAVISEVRRLGPTNEFTTIQLQSAGQGKLFRAYSSDIFRIYSQGAIKTTSFIEGGVYNFDLLTDCPIALTTSSSIDRSSSSLATTTSKMIETVNDVKTTEYNTLSSHATLISPSTIVFTTADLELDSELASQLVTELVPATDPVLHPVSLQSKLESTTSSGIARKTRINYARNYTSSLLESWTTESLVHSTIADIKDPYVVPIFTTVADQQSSPSTGFLPARLEDTPTSGLAYIAYAIVFLAIVRIISKRLLKKSPDDESILTVKKYKKRTPQDAD